MIVSPNSFERYLAALRIYVTQSIIKHGITPKKLNNLKKIQLTEAILNKNSLQSVNINQLVNNLLNAVRIYKYDLYFTCKSKNNFFINKRLFTILILEVCKNANNIFVTAEENNILLKFSGKCKNFKFILDTLNAQSFFEIKNNYSLITVPTEKANEKSVYIESEWEYMFNEFSEINIFFLNDLH